VQASTIEAQARLLAADPALMEWSPLVPLKPDGGKPPFYCVHPGGGNALCYRTLADSFDDDRPFIAIQAHGVDDRQQQPDTIEEMATAYVAAIQAAQPQGPYFLGGWSFGGLVAYEMARQLIEAGSHVETLAIIDAGFRYSLAVVRTMFLRDDVPLFHMSSLDQAELLTHFRGPSSKAQLVPPGASDDLVARILKVFVGNCDAIFRFRPQSFPGRAVLFTAAEKLVKKRVRRDARQEWSDLCRGGVQEVFVPGNHLTMINPPHAANLAAGIAAACDGQVSAGQFNAHTSALFSSSSCESSQGR
jgi:thioesterase domain-containing protein